ncbi:MAG: ATP-grasp domain-containing protein [Alphaproteobacteria bacterium]
MGRLLLLIPTTSYRAADFLDAARRLDVDVVVGSNHRQVLEEFSQGGALSLDVQDPERASGRILAYARERPLDAIISTDDDAAVLAAKASAALGLPHNRPEAVAATRNKHQLRSVLLRAGVPSPPFSLVSTGDNPARAARSAPFPCVLKPLAMSASRGVIRADDPAQFTSAFHRIVKILSEPDVAALGEAARQILVEGYVPGVEVALEGLLDRGRLHVLALFDKPDPLEGPYFEETIYVSPSRLPERVQKEIAAASSQAVKAIGLEDGPIHAELRVNEDGVWVIDVAARSIGGLCSRVLRFGAGIRLEELILRHAMGLPIEGLERERRPAGVMMIPIQRAGTLRQVRGLGDARKVEGIEGVTVSIPIGHRVEPLPEGSRYLGFIFARNETPEAVEAALREAHRRLTFLIEPTSGA